MTLSINPTTFPLNEAHFLISGPSGHLELLTQPAKNQAIGVAVICHPHPLYQGTMNNKVVTTLTRAFHDKQLHTVRFNFRGVGKSEGVFGNSIGEVDDLRAVLQWVDTTLVVPKIWLAGFSFGAYIAAMGATQHHCQQLYSVAPAVTNQPYNSLKPITCPWVIIQGEEDEVIPMHAVETWFLQSAKIQTTMSFHKLNKASHFFHGNLIQLRNMVVETFVGD